MRDQVHFTRWLILLAVTAIALYLCWLMVQPFVDVLVWAVVLVIIFYPLHLWLVARFKRPGLMAVASSVLVIVTILVPVSIVSVIVARELVQIADNTQAAAHDIITDPAKAQKARAAIDWVSQYVNLKAVFSPDAIKAQIGRVSGVVAQSTLTVVGGLTNLVVEIIFVIFTMYYFFRDGEKIVAKISDMLPLSDRQSREILSRTRDIISASLYGVLVIAIIQGTLGGVMFWLLGLPSAIVWGVLMVLLSMIPMAGSFVVWVPAAIFLALTGHWGKALFLAAWGGLVIGSIDNFLRPKLIGDKTKLHELLIFFSVLGGLKVFGVLGIVLGPVIVAVTLALIQVVRQVDEGSGEVSDEAAEPEQA